MVDDVYLGCLQRFAANEIAQAGSVMLRGQFQQRPLAWRNAQADRLVCCVQSLAPRLYDKVIRLYLTLSCSTEKSIPADEANGFVRKVTSSIHNANDCDLIDLPVICIRDRLIKN